MFLDGKIVQHTVTALQPGLAGCEEIESGTETGFSDYKAIKALPALLEFIRSQKDMARFRQPVMAGKIHIAILPGNRHGSLPVKFGRSERGIFGRRFGHSLPWRSVSRAKPRVKM